MIVRRRAPALGQSTLGARHPDRVRQLGEYYRTLDPRTYPATTAVADVLPGATIDEEFEFGLSLIIDGLENTRRRILRSEAKASRSTDTTRP